MGDKQCCEAGEWLKERIHDKKHFTARLVASASEASGAEKEMLVKVAAGVLAVILAFSEHAHFFANSILIGVPIVLIFVFPSEKPSDESLFVYFSLFGLLTVMDRALERIPCYFILKLALFVLLFIPPYVLHERIARLVKEQLYGALTEPRSSRSTRSTRSALKTAPTQVPSVVSPAEPPKPVEEPPKPAEPEQKPEQKPAEAQPVVSKTDMTDGPGRMKEGTNPMESSSFHKLKTESDGFAGTPVGPGNNLNDMLFFPTNALIFNGPFDVDNTTYHMKVINNSHHRIAYAIKGNAVPRVMANPAFGVMKPKDQRLIAVTVQKFDWNEADFKKDRIAFDYVLLPDDNKSENFAMEMFQKSDSKRRKNIQIQYNP